jgi:hypothetical protein
VEARHIGPVVFAEATSQEGGLRRVEGQVWNAGSAVWDGDELLAGESVEGRRAEGSEESVT